MDAQSREKPLWATSQRDTKNNQPTMANEKTKTTKAPKQGEKPEPKAAKAPKVASAPQTTAHTPANKIEKPIRLHGKEFVGVVISDKAHKTVTVEWERRRLIPKYERYERRYSRVYAHNPETINAKMGDTVRIKETRPLSKTKHFVVVEVMK